MAEELNLPEAIERWWRKDAPKSLRESVKGAGGGPIFSADYPYPKKMSESDYLREMGPLQIELVKLQSWAKKSGARVAIVFEGRDAAGKGGTIRRFTENLNPRGARVVALPKPTPTEAGQWYFQRYIGQLPSPGEIVFFDRSWYNRGVVEHVFGFCTPEQRARWFRTVPGFERALADDGIVLIKLWLTIPRAEQLRRFLDRARDPLKHWKLSPIDASALDRWDDYTVAIRETLERTHSEEAPWSVIRAEDKRRARLQAIRVTLSGLDYADKDGGAVGAPDPALVGPPYALSTA